MTFYMNDDDTIYEDGKEVEFAEDEKGNVTYTIITSEDESSEDPYVISDNPEDLYYTNCAEGSDNEWEQFESHTPERADSDLLRLADSINNHNRRMNNNISNKYLSAENNITIGDMLNLQSESCMDLREYNASNNYRGGYRRPPVVSPELLRRVDRFLSSKYACSSRDVGKPAGLFLYPVLSNKATYNTVDGAYIYSKIGLLNRYFNDTDKFDEIVNNISERLAWIA